MLFVVEVFDFSDVFFKGPRSEFLSPMRVGSGLFFDSSLGSKRLKGVLD